MIPCPRLPELIEQYAARGNKAPIAGVEEVKQLILSDPLAGLGWYMDRLSDSRVHQAPAMRCEILMLCLAKNTVLV